MPVIVVAIMPHATCRSKQPEGEPPPRHFPAKRNGCYHRHDWRHDAGLRMFAAKTMMICASVAVCFVTSAPARATGCRSAPQGEGRVAEIIDARTFRLHDGREVRLAGIEPVDISDVGALTRLIAGRGVTLHGETDTPDRYGRQPAFAFLDDAAPSVQSQLLAQGAAMASLAVPDKDCTADLSAAEASARRARAGLWGQPGVIKNAESPGDILADVGRFRLVEGRVLSVRTAGATTYLNFGRNWTQDFAVTISRRMMATLEAAGVSPRSFERRRIRVRGFIERRGGPRIEVLRAGQIEVAGDK
jgi:endonuclease YncB( thermonuclease family)